ncbi:cache domain-containing protein, partial [Candidatus Poribacteria bacterium]|nr:cache domain-containing protein [Candidatus Poribacteria bacterium]
MPFFGRLTIRSQLILMLLLVSVGATAVVAHLGFRSGRANLTACIYQQLTSVRSSKAYQLTSYFAQLRNQAATFAEDRMVVDAARELRDSYRQMDGVTPDRDADERLRAYYRDEFLPRIADTRQGVPIVEAYLPKAPESRRLQHAYIATNPNPSGQKHLLDDAGDGSAYSAAHARIHPLLRNIVDRFGYHDLFLIDPDTGVIIYSVFKETDFTTNLLTGPYKNSSLAAAFRTARDAKGSGFTTTVDFRPYGPSGGAPAAFMASPMYDGAELVGVFASQIPVDEINRVTTGGEAWSDNGLGATGEAYIVGADGTMRSVSRFLVENPQGYIEALRSLGIPSARLARIEAFGTSVLQQEVATEAITEASLGRQGTTTMPDYRGVDVLSSYAPLAIPDLDWVIVAEMDAAEAFAPVYRFRQTVLICSAVIVLVVTGLAMAMANIFVAPV